MKVVVGGDYGFTITPMGQNARDIGHFVKFFGYSPAEALRCATVVGGELMGRKGDLGLICEGALADLPLVDGDPFLDRSVLVGPGRFAMIRENGRMHRDPRAREGVTNQVAAEWRRRGRSGWARRLSRARSPARSAPRHRGARASPP